MELQYKLRRYFLPVSSPNAKHITNRIGPKYGRASPSLRAALDSSMLLENPQTLVKSTHHPWMKFLKKTPKLCEYQFYKRLPEF